MKSLRVIVPSLFTLAVLMAPALFAASPSETAPFLAAAEALRPVLIELRRDFHQHPELSNREERTSRIIAERLKSLGIPVETGVAKFGVVATIAGAKKGKTIAVRADIDALPVTETIDVPYRSQNPGVKHACGHDAHTAIGLGVAEILWKNRSRLAGTVHVIFQPAEEGPPTGEEGGAPLMLKEGLLEKLRPSAMYALHTMPTVEAGTISWTPGAEMASADRFRIVVSGKGSHGAAPHLGIDPIVIASQVVLALQTIDSRRIDPIEAVVVTVGSFHAGTRFNIIPDTAEMHGTVRTLSSEVRERTMRSIEEIVSGVARANGAEGEVTFDLSLPVLKNDEKVSLRGEAALQNLLGKEKVIHQPPRMIAEDFAVFAEKVPSFYFFLGVGNRSRGITASLHTPEFDIDEEALVVGTKAMLAVVLDGLKQR